MILDSPTVDQAMAECDPPLVDPQCTEDSCNICNPCLALYTPPSPESLPSDRSRRASSVEGRPERGTQSEPPTATPAPPTATPDAEAPPTPRRVVAVKIHVKLEVVAAEAGVEITRTGMGEGQAAPEAAQR
jgi:hypothetical protein